jgi:NTE family protein
MVKIAIRLLPFIVFVGCATRATHTKMGPPEPHAVNNTPKTVEPTLPEIAPVDEPSMPDMTPTPETPVVNEPPASSVLKIIPKIGIIFSGGGAKAWAHIGVIKEMEKAKWPIFATAGFEWGAAVAGVYANNLSSNEVEWELSKVKDLESIEESSNAIFGKKSVADMKVPFVCPSLNISKQIIYLLNRGQLNKLMPFCLAQPPLSKAFGQSIAEMNDIASLAQHLRSTGANKIVVINVLAQNLKHSFTNDYLSSDNILWVESAALMAKKIAGVDDIVSINLDNYSIKDLDKRREIIAKGAELGYVEIKKLTNKYGL